MLAVGDERLGAVDHVFVAVRHGAGTDALQIRPRPGLGHGDRHDDIAGHAGGQVRLHLGVAAVVDDVGHGDIAVHGPAQARAAGARNLFVDDRVVAEVRRCAAIGLRNLRREVAMNIKRLQDLRRQVALGPGPAPEVTIDLPRFLPVAVVRHHLLLQEAADARPKLLVLFVVNRAWNLDPVPRTQGDS